MFDTLAACRSTAFVTDGSKAIGAAVAARLRDDPATVLTPGPAWPRDVGSHRLFVASDIELPSAGAAIANAVSVGGDRDLRPQVQADTAMKATSLNAIERLVKSLAVGLTVFTVGVAAFVAVFAWWILVVEPAPRATPLAQVTMPLFPHGYRPPNQHGG